MDLRLETCNRWQHTLHKAKFPITLKFWKVPKEEKSDRLLAEIVLKTDEANGLVSKERKWDGCSTGSGPPGTRTFCHQACGINLRVNRSTDVENILAGWAGDRSATHLPLRRRVEPLTQVQGKEDLDADMISPPKDENRSLPWKQVQNVSYHRLSKHNLL